MMMHKLVAMVEAGFVLLAIHWQPVFGIASAICAAAYYLSMLKMNVVDRKYNRSWMQFIKSIFK